MAHSPTPWRSGGEANDCILSWLDGTVLIFYPGYKQEDMEFIFRAVNCHDELAEALRYWLPDETQIPAGHTKAWHEAVNLLAKVQGK